MIKLLKCEHKKTKGKHLLLTVLTITILSGIWAFYGDYSGDNSSFILQNGYMMFLYQLPLTNAIFFPLLAAVTASRLCDIEHKGGSFKILCTLTSKGKLFDAKLIYGLALVLLSVALLWVSTLIFGKAIGFTGEIPIRLYLLYLLFTAVPTAAVYIFQHSLSMIFKNQAIPFFIGLLGQFTGLFSMFLPQLPWLRKSVLWGYYGALQLVGMFGWTKETRYSTAYFEAMNIDWTAFIIIVSAAVIIYIAGRKIFCRKEI